MYYLALSIVVILVYTNPLTTASISAFVSLLYATLALAMMFYPLSGFMADVCCGRLKMVLVSLTILLACGLTVCFIEILVFIFKLETIAYDDYATYLHRSIIQVLFGFSLVSLVLLMIGLAGFQANYVQLGLDQLFEVPTRYLRLFIHYSIWAFHLGLLPLRIIDSFVSCSHPGRIAIPPKIALFSIPFIISFVLIALLIIYRWKRHWFYSEPGQENPYLTVFMVIKFAKKYKYPLRRSAFTYSDDIIPSRIDLSKERFGGPFTTEQVENVKTFFRILLILFVLGPVFALEVPSSYFVFPLFGLHDLHYRKHIGKDFCDTIEHKWESGFIETGSLMTLLSLTCLFPIYTCIINFSPLCKKVMNNMFCRIQLGAAFCLLGVISLLVIDVVGHSLHGTTGLNNTQCMFQVYRTNTTASYPALNLHWSVLIPPNLFLGIGPLIVISTTYEFISAQSPQSMKGLLIGVFFAIRGLFHFLNSIVILGFSFKNPWASGAMSIHPLVTNCGFIYLLFTCIMGLVGLSLFSIAAKKYKYRERDEGMFRQQDVEEIYERYITQAAEDSLSELYTD
jgi:peptide/histidine transporter 3/4